MSDPIELTRRGTDDVIALACGKCGTVHGLSDPDRARYLIERCCVPAPCRDCGGAAERGWSVCRTCSACNDAQREAAAIAKASRVSLADYLVEMGADAMICTDRLGGEEHYTSPSYCDEPWAWACTRQGWPTLDAESVAEGMCEEMYDGAIDRLDVAALQTALDTWLEAQGDACAWMVDGTRIVVLSEDGGSDGE